VFTLTAHPSSSRSAWMRGEPWCPRGVERRLDRGVELAATHLPVCGFAGGHFVEPETMRGVAVFCCRITSDLFSVLVLTSGSAAEPTDRRCVAASSTPAVNDGRPTPRGAPMVHRASTLTCSRTGGR